MSVGVGDPLSYANSTTQPLNSSERSMLSISRVPPSTESSITFVPYIPNSWLREATTKGVPLIVLCHMRSVFHSNRSFNSSFESDTSLHSSSVSVVCIIIMASSVISTVATFTSFFIRGFRVQWRWSGPFSPLIVAYQE